MADPRTWTFDDVAARFEEAASTGRRLPPVRVQAWLPPHQNLHSLNPPGGNARRVLLLGLPL